MWLLLPDWDCSRYIWDCIILVTTICVNNTHIYGDVSTDYSVLLWEKQRPASKHQKFCKWIFTLLGSLCVSFLQFFFFFSLPFLFFFPSLSLFSWRENFSTDNYTLLFSRLIHKSQWPRFLKVCLDYAPTYCGLMIAFFCFVARLFVYYGRCCSSIAVWL